MLQSSTIQFLKSLKKNNNKEWFDKNRQHYELAKTDFLSLVTIVLNEIQVFDPTLIELQPKQCIFRLQFANFKPLYKDSCPSFIICSSR